MNMKLNPNSTHVQISKHEVIHPSEKSMKDIYHNYVHPLYEYNDDITKKAKELKRPNPPTKEAIEKAKFVDKTYNWSGSSSVRPRDKRTDS